MFSFFSGPAKPKPEETSKPYLKLCKTCTGKGQTSYLNQFQVKTYGPCKGCSNQSGPYALGVSLKCRCRTPSCPYSFLFSTDVKQIKQWWKEPELRALADFQKRLGAGGNALLIICDKCNAQYLAQDSAQERRKISTTEELNEADKEYNRLIANTLIENGLYAEVESDTGFIKELPRRKTPSNTSVASTTNDTGAAVSQQEDRASTGRAQTEVAPVSDQQQARTPLQQLEAKVADAARAEAETDARASAQAAAGPSPFATEQRLRIGVQRPDHEQDLVPAPPSAGHVVAATPRAQAAALALQKSLSQGRTSLPMAGSLNPVESQVSVGSSLQSALSKAKMRTNSLFSLTEDEIAQIQKVTVDDVPAEEVWPPVIPEGTVHTVHVEPQANTHLRPQQTANAPITPVDVE